MTNKNMKVDWVTDTSGYQQFRTIWPFTLNRFGEHLAKNIVKDVKIELSKSMSPASPGHPPGRVTSDLYNSITFTKKAPLTWWVHDGVPYGIYLELGRINRRTGMKMTWPFMIPVFLRWRTGKAQMAARTFKWQSSIGGFAPASPPRGT